MIYEGTPLWGAQAQRIVREDLEEQYQQAFGPVPNIAELSSWAMLDILGDRYNNPYAKGPEAEHNPDTGINLPDPPPTTD